MPLGGSVKAHLEEMRARDPQLQAEYERLGPRFEVISELIRARNREGLTQRELGRRMGVSQAVVSRLFSGEHSPRIDTIAAAARAMGYDLEVRLVKRGEAERRVAEEPGEYER
jgi:transcriptional regulator with XRE-family HTH domain